MRKTKIICTLGPASESENTLREMIKAGMNVARFNFSHGSHEEHQKRLDVVKKLRKELDVPLATLLDTKGPEIRLGKLKDGKAVLQEGNPFVLTTEDLLGDDTIASITFKDLPRDVSKGDHILIDDGLIELLVEKVEDTRISCVVLNGGPISDRKGVNVPNVDLSMPYLSDKDRDDIRFGIKAGFDFIAASFTRCAQDILQIREILEENGCNTIKIIAKIENAQGVNNIDEILRVSDGIMIARGDMGVEIPAQEVPHIQKEIIRKCNEHYTPVITATQMLDSMMRNPRPTRAEVTDVANAVYDGTDAVMLSGETAQGKYPLEALQMMVHIIEQTEKHLDYDSMLEKEHGHLRGGVSSAIGYSSVLAAANLNAKCIITPSVSGATSRVVSNLRPRQEILGVTPNERTLRRMSIYWGVRPLKSLEVDTTEDICENAIELAQVKQYVEPGDVVVITAGIPSTNVSKERSFTSNMMRIVTVD